MSAHRCRTLLFLCICTNFIVLKAQQKSDEANRVDVVFNTDFVPAYTIACNADLLNSTTCREELINLCHAIDQRITWGLKMLDASGRPKEGFIYGNNLWLGSRSQCLDITNMSPLKVRKIIANNTQYLDPQQEFPPFGVNYFVAHFRHNSTLQHLELFLNENIVTLGMCLPFSCSTVDLSFILEKLFRDRVLPISDLYSLDFQLTTVRDLRYDHQWLLDGATLFIGSVFILSCSLMITGTICEILIRRRERNRLSAHSLEKISCDNVLQREIFLTSEMNVRNEMSEIKSIERIYSSFSSSASKEVPPSCDTNSLNVKNEPVQTAIFSLRTSKTARVLMCFSVISNTAFIFNTQKNDTLICSIYGLRSISMMWIIITHVVYYSKDFIDNNIMLWRLTEEFLNQMIANVFVAVDTFFCISGFLLVYTYSKKHATNKKQTDYETKLKEIFVTLINRFIRLTPAYMMTIGITYFYSSVFSQTSQYYMSEKSHELCAKYWWRNLLYIQNYFTFDTMCLSWSWYLANDMQFFLIGLILLSLFFTRTRVFIATLCALLIGTIVVSGYVSYVNDFTSTLDDIFRTKDDLYSKPWIRIGPYIIGMFAACIVRKIDKGLVLKKKNVIIFWCLSSTFLISVINAPYWRHTVLIGAFYMALNKTCWAIGVAWIIVICYSKKNEGIVNRILSWKLWIPLAKLSYCAYLINPVVINVFSMMNEAVVHVTIVSMMTTGLGYLILSYVFGYILCIMSEVPYIRLYKMYTSAGREK